MELENVSRYYSDTVGKFLDTNQETILKVATDADTTVSVTGKSLEFSRIARKDSLEQVEDYKPYFEAEKESINAISSYPVSMTQTDSEILFQVSVPVSDLDLTEYTRDYFEVGEAARIRDALLSSLWSLPGGKSYYPFSVPGPASV